MAHRNNGKYVTSQHKELLDRLDLLVESDRLLTFQNWPYMACLVLPEDLARSGFYYLGYLDRAQCFSCNVLLTNWKFGTIAEENHRLHSPQCRMVKGTEVRNKPIIVSSVGNECDSPPSKHTKKDMAQTQSDPIDFSDISSHQNQFMSTAQQTERVNDDSVNADALIEHRFSLHGAEIKRAYIGDQHHYHDHRTFIVQSDAETTMLQQEHISELQRELKIQARTASEYIKLPINIQQSITPVTLEITTNLMQAFENPDDTGHGHRREDFLNALARPQGDVIMEELFSQARRRAMQEAITMSGEIKQSVIRIEGNIVGVIGQAGIGKTTLTKMFTKRILDEAILTADYLFFIPLRYVDFSSKASLIRFLVSSSSCDWHHDETCDKELLEKLKQNSNVVIIFDGLDEARMDLTQPPTASNAFCDKAETFIRNILTGKLLSFAKKLVTSRPRQFYDMLAEYRPSFIVAISGLSKESQLHLCRELCGDNHTQVIQYLEEHRNIFAYCYVPVNCILTMHCVHQSLGEESDVNLNSITSILAYALDKFLRSPIIRDSGSSVERGKFEPEKLCHLAWKGFSQKKIIFNEEELREAYIDDNMLNAFFQTNVDTDLKFRILEHDKQSYFSHLIWQEFFTAIELMFFMPLLEFSALRCNFNTSRWENVTKFLYGLCNPEAFSRLKRLFPLSVNQNEKRLALKDFAFECMPAVYENDSTPTLLRVFDWIAEAQTESFTKTIVDALPEIIKIRGTFHSGDVSNLNYVLRATRDFHIIEAGFGFNMLTFTGDSFFRFFEELEVTLQAKPNLNIAVLKIINSNICNPGMQHLCRCLHNLEELTIFQSHLAPPHLNLLAQGMQECSASLKELQLIFDDENEQGCRSLAACVPYIRILDIRFSTISSEGYRILSEAIQAREEPLKLLMFRGNEIDDEAAEAISRCVNKVDSLNMEANQLTGVGAEKIAKAIQRREQMVELLKFDQSQISDQGGIAISSCLEKIQHLLLMYCGITSVGVTAMSETLQTLQQHQLHTLDLSANAIDDTGTNALSFGLQSIKNLILINCNITWRGVQKLSEAIASLETPMEELNISFNKIGDEGIEAMLGCLSNIGHFNVSGCDVTKVGGRKLSAAISSFHHHAVKLTLDKNQIGDEGVEALCVNLNHISYLSLKRCGLTRIGIRFISDSMPHQQNALEKLDISENNIGDAGIEEITMCFKDIKLLFINSCRMTLEGAKRLSNALNQLPQPMKRLSLNNNDIGADGGIALSTCLQKVQTLDITQCNIIGAGVMAMSKAIKAMTDGDNCSVVGLYAQ